jgi:hypothetical protein
VIETPYWVRYLRNGGDKPDFDASFIISNIIDTVTYEAW